MFLKQLNISVESLWPLPYSCHELQTLLKNILSHIPTDRNVELDLLILDNPASAELNQQYLQSLGPTNILSFPWQEDQHLGCLALCLPMLYQEARLYSLTPQTHALNLIAHGLLHLLGYEHGSDMEKLQEQLLYEISDLLPKIL